VAGGVARHVYESDGTGAQRGWTLEGAPGLTDFHESHRDVTDKPPDQRRHGWGCLEVGIDYAIRLLADEPQQHLPLQISVADDGATPGHANQDRRRTLALAGNLEKYAFSAPGPARSEDKRTVRTQTNNLDVLEDAQRAHTGLLQRIAHGVATLGHRGRSLEQRVCLRHHDVAPCQISPEFAQGALSRRSGGARGDAAVWPE
jgi:hypothetical protein